MVLEPNPRMMTLGIPDLQILRTVIIPNAVEMMDRPAPRKRATRPICTSRTLNDKSVIHHNHVSPLTAHSETTMPPKVSLECLKGEARSAPRF